MRPQNVRSIIYQVMGSIIKIENITFRYVPQTSRNPAGEDSAKRGAGDDGHTGFERGAGDDGHAGLSNGAGDDDAAVLRNLSLEIEDGSFVAIIGQNGSGKSTLAKHMNGLLIPTEGRVLVNGWDTSDDEHILDIRRTAGMVFQNPDNQLVSSIVEDDVAFGPENLGIEPSEIRRRVDSALESVEMSEYRKRPPHLLSGGQKQRVAIAGVIAMLPSCIIFDEPTAMLDPKGRAEIMKIIRRLNSNGMTCVLITHFMDEAVLADRVVIVDGGRVVADESPATLFRRRDMIRKINLDVPLVAELAYQLRRDGYDMPQDIVTQEGMVEYLCQLK